MEERTSNINHIDDVNTKQVNEILPSTEEKLLNIKMIIPFVVIQFPFKVVSLHHLHLEYIHKRYSSRCRFN